MYNNNLFNILYFIFYFHLLRSMDRPKKNFKNTLSQIQRYKTTNKTQKVRGKEGKISLKNKKKVKISNNIVKVGKTHSKNNYNRSYGRSNLEIRNMENNLSNYRRYSKNNSEIENNLKKYYRKNNKREWKLSKSSLPSNNNTKKKWKQQIKEINNINLLKK